MARKACLGIDTATGFGSVAVDTDDGPPLVRRLLERTGHARDLIPALESLLLDAGLARADLRGIGVSAGPGSFTGLRVGMATAKGLAYALDIALEGLSTLEALARAASVLVPSGIAHLAPVLSAGRGEIYGALFARREGAVERLTGDRLWKPEKLLASLPSDVILVGDGVEAVGNAVRGGPAPLSIEHPPLAGAIAAWAAARIAPGALYRPGSLVPNYIRPSDAEAARRRA